MVWLQYGGLLALAVFLAEYYILFVSLVKVGNYCNVNAICNRMNFICKIAALLAIGWCMMMIASYAKSSWMVHHNIMCLSGRAGLLALHPFVSGPLMCLYCNFSKLSHTH